MAEKKQKPIYRCCDCGREITRDEIAAHITTDDVNDYYCKRCLTIVFRDATVGKMLGNISTARYREILDYAVHLHKTGACYVVIK